MIGKSDDLVSYYIEPPNSLCISLVLDNSAVSFRPVQVVLFRQPDRRDERFHDFEAHYLCSRQPLDTVSYEQSNCYSLKAASGLDSCKFWSKTSSKFQVAHYMDCQLEICSWYPLNLIYFSEIGLYQLKPQGYG